MIGLEERRSLRSQLLEEKRPEEERDRLAEEVRELREKIRRLQDENRRMTASRPFWSTTHPTTGAGGCPPVGSSIAGRYGLTNPSRSEGKTQGVGLNELGDRVLIGQRNPFGFGACPPQ